ncbi:hypothetical protein [Streptomyces sp. NPDC052107]|uniref:hypothetical protein n=1 Tax=Streptomyces sp. NPDC052107 TaxID=3155632 RepID=UPI00343A4AF5
MSRSVDFDFTFRRSVGVVEVIRILLESGMRASNDDDVSYLIDEEGMFDWKKSASSGLDEIISAIGDKRLVDHTVGITLYFPDSISGGDFLFHPGREVVSCVIGVNPRRLEGSIFCDIGWYATKMIPWLEPLGLLEVETRDTA